MDQVSESIEITPAPTAMQLQEITALLKRQVELMELSRQEHLESMARYDAVIRAYETSDSRVAIPTGEPG